MENDAAGAPNAPRPTPVPAPAPEPGPIESELQALEAQFALVLGRPERVEASCRALRVLLEPAGEGVAARCGARLLPLLQQRQGPVATALLPFLEEQAERAAEPRAFVLGLLAARDDGVRRRGLELACRLTESGRLPVDLETALAAAALLEQEAGLGSDAGALASLRELLRRLPAPRGTPPGDDPLLRFLAPEQPLPLRRLAARILDQADTPAPPERWSELLEPTAAEALAPHLQYTRATHADLVDLTAEPDALRASLGSFRDAERVLGSSLLSMVISELGWGRVAGGLTCRRWVGVSVDRGLPFAVTPVEAAWLGSCVGARRLWDRFLVVARGLTGAPVGRADGEDAAVRRFRDYNVVHAELLGLIIEVAPLTLAKVRQILSRLDRVVADFAVIFEGHSEDARRVETVYARLRAESLAAIEGMPEDRPLPSDATRLVQMFEDPKTLDEVRTLHGLKRYLHQQGLRLAFRVFRSGRSTNRTVDLLLAAPHRVLQVVRRIRYLDFEPDPEAGPTDLPFPVALLAEALGRRLLAEKPEWPDAEVLVYGNEVQAFVRFRNHPVFLRMDLSPPQRGGMIDLEYFGVSQYELDRHPDLSLPWIQRVFRRLDFDVQADGQHLHVRYDKERAFDLGDLVSRARRLCSLLPHLMELDWVIGRLSYPAPVREAVADAWTDRLVQWGWLPIAESLTADRGRILCAVTPDPAGEREVPWDGRDEYRDRFSRLPDAEIWNRLREGVRARGLDAHARWERTAGAPFAQLPLEESLLEPFREAAARGELREIAGGHELVSTGLDRRAHEAETLARLLEAGGDRLHAAVRSAFVVRSIERHLRFLTVGAIQRHPVQRASLVLRGERVELVVLRDANGIARLALAFDLPQQLGPGSPPLTLSRADRRLDDAELIRRLRRDNYLAAGYEPPIEGEDPDELRDRFAVPDPVSPPAPAPGERTVAGIAASPGSAAGFARLAAEGRTAGEVDGAVLVAPAIRPEDTPLIRRAAAVVSTGGGILSHAGLIALETHTPALVIAGCWRRDAAGANLLAYRFLDYREETSTVGPYEVVQRCDLQEREDLLRDGDLLVVDAEAGVLTVLGQDRDTLALHEEIHRLQAAADEFSRAGDGAEELAQRGGWLRAVHALQRVLARLDRPALARHAARELLLAVRAPATPACRSEVGRLLRTLLENPRCGEVAAHTARELHAELSRRREALGHAARSAIPTAPGPFEVLQLRLAVRHVEQALVTVHSGLAQAGLPTDPIADWPEIDATARRRLVGLRREAASFLLAASGDAGTWWRRTHMLATVENLDRVLGTEDGPPDRDRLGRVREDLAARRAARLGELSEKRILTARDGGLELAPLIGAKGANLGEVARILGDERTPPWFAVTDAAFRTILRGGAGTAAATLGLHTAHASLGDAIDEILARDESEPRRKASAIRQLWQSVPLPADLEREILDAYRSLGAAGEPPGAEDAPFVAVRSSAFDEDTESTSWAGQFDTFLFVRGEDALRHHLKLALAGLWTERALEHRGPEGGTAERRGGGVLVQRIVHARAAGVLHTLSTATGQLREMVVNAGLGMGEGVVSGTVEVDHIVVSRETPTLDDPLSIRYLVGDKSSRIVFDRRTGSGTRREETLYHQRLRPALEYTDLGELVRASARLEQTYGYPLDVEFAFEDDTLSILQVRPIVAFQNALRETVERFPLPGARTSPQEDGPS